MLLLPKCYYAAELQRRRCLYFRLCQGLKNRDPLVLCFLYVGMGASIPHFGILMVFISLLHIDVQATVVGIHT